LGLKIAYFSYPFSDDPARRTREAVKIASYIFKKYGVFPLIPHVAVDVYRGRVSTVDILRAEHALIRRCDMVIVGGEMSTGVMWEVAYAKELGKPVYRFTGKVLKNEG
jgi:nucleoside 2-deoxyribosyltransferase